MKSVRITVLRKAAYPDLMERYENPIEHSCTVEEGQVFLSEEGRKPEGLCESAWESMRPFAETLAAGGGNFYDGWMKNEHSALISCNDGFRPVSFLLEALEPCPVCGCPAFAEPGQYEICPFCGWEDDPLQARDPDLAGGANRMSLNEARAAYERN